MQAQQPFDIPTAHIKQMLLFFKGLPFAGETIWLQDIARKTPLTEAQALQALEELGLSQWVHGSRKAREVTIRDQEVLNEKLRTLNARSRKRKASRPASEKESGDGAGKGEGDGGSKKEKSAAKESSTKEQS